MPYSSTRAPRNSASAAPSNCRRMEASNMTAKSIRPPNALFNCQADFPPPPLEAQVSLAHLHARAGRHQDRAAPTIAPGSSASIPPVCHAARLICPFAANGDVDYQYPRRQSALRRDGVARPRQHARLAPAARVTSFPSMRSGYLAARQRLLAGTERRRGQQKGTVAGRPHHDDDLSDGCFVLARQVNFETIHNHDVVAERHGAVRELRGELASRGRRTTSPPVSGCRRARRSIGCQTPTWPPWRFGAEPAHLGTRNACSDLDG